MVFVLENHPSTDLIPYGQSGAQSQVIKPEFEQLPKYAWIHSE